GGKARRYPTLLPFLRGSAPDVCAGTNAVCEGRASGPACDGTYFEPCCGGAATFFALKTAGLIGQAVLNDLSEPLVCAFTQVRENVEEVIGPLHGLADTHAAADAAVEAGKLAESSHFYYRERAVGLRSQAYVPEDERAARIIHLNRACFNGVWRVNAGG